MEPKPFAFQPIPSRVIFGAGALRELDPEVALLGWQRVLIVSTPGRSSAVNETVAILGSRVASVFPHAVVHVPEALATRAAEHASQSDCDGVIAVGGGSAIGLAKILALRLGLGYLAIPTTYSGSEMTTIWGTTDQGEKRTGRDPRLHAKTVIYDPELTLSLPADRSAFSGINALAHASEALYAPDASPLSSLYACTAIRTLRGSLPAVVESPENLTARHEALYGSWLAGACLGMTSMGLHHHLCHVAGGLFDLPHAETHAALLPHVLRFNLEASESARMSLCEIFESDNPAVAIFEFERRLGANADLETLGMPRSGIPRLVEKAMERRVGIPRAYSAEDLTRIVTAAFVGDLPASSSATPAASPNR